jgi:hypothetical protein
MRIYPVYGYGWHKGNTSIEVPGPMELFVTKSEENFVEGIVSSKDNIFYGTRCEMHLRHANSNSRTYSVVFARSPDDCDVTGYVESRS